MSPAARPKDGERKGFGGLAGLVSDVETSIPESSTSPRPPAESPLVSQSGASGQGAPLTTRRPPEPARSSSGKKWAIGIAAVVAVAWILVQSTEKSSSAGRNPGGSSTPSQRTTPRLTTLDETKPPPGTDQILSISQIRYCLAEDIRLGAAKAVINAHADSEVDRFNAMVDEHKIRCGQFLYGEGTLESARSDVESHRSELEDDGRSRFRSSFDGAAVTPRGSDGSANVDWQAVFAEEASREAPEPDPTVRAIQKELNVLGYDAGPADGMMGSRTRDAVLAFQTERGIDSDGVASVALLQHLTRMREGGEVATPRSMPLSQSGDKEVMPAPGGMNRTLNSSEIRYCLAESIRIGAAKNVVNEYSDSQVDRFNAMVDDYNARCGRYQYRRGSLESVRSSVEKRRLELEAEGRARFR